MNEAQYHRVRENRRRMGAAQLSELSVREARRVRGGRDRLAPLAAVVADASRVARRLAEARVAWGRVADASWLAETEVSGVRQRSVVVAVSNSALCYELRRRVARVQGALSRLMPGVERVVFVVDGGGFAGGR